jgi:hypothetical protein
MFVSQLILINVLNPRKCARLFVVITRSGAYGSEARGQPHQKLGKFARNDTQVHCYCAGLQGEERMKLMNSSESDVTA